MQCRRSSRRGDTRRRRGGTREGRVGLVRQHEATVAVARRAPGKASLVYDSAGVFGRGRLNRIDRCRAHGTISSTAIGRETRIQRTSSRKSEDSARTVTSGPCCHLRCGRGPSLLAKTKQATPITAPPHIVTANPNMLAASACPPSNPCSCGAWGSDRSTIPSAGMKHPPNTPHTIGPQGKQNGKIEEGEGEGEDAKPDQRRLDGHSVPPRLQGGGVRFKAAGGEDGQSDA
ncbi:hypothetical protein C8Q76DRAFT_140602 [Earliella scabrosa]|nr:hypothetical protein C8Q76DRAFT_140602 [Earliella scabrosa]